MTVQVLRRHSRCAALRWQHTASYVRVAVQGDPTIDEFRAILRQIADDAGTWERAALLLDLSAMRREFGLAEQFLLGGLMAHKLSQLRMVAALQAPGLKPSAACQRQANLGGAKIRAFDDESAALDWLLGVDSHDVRMPVAPALA
jgi:SpoIIAA-like